MSSTNWNTFVAIYLVGVIFVIVEGLFACRDGFFTEAQMAANGWVNMNGSVKGWSFMSHGGMWSDVSVIPLLVAFFASRYNLQYFTWQSLVIALLSIGITLYMVKFMYEPMGVDHPEVFTHNGYTTTTGWIHCVYAIIALYIMGMAYLGVTGQRVVPADMLIASCILTVFFVLGVVKFSSRWHWDQTAVTQVIVCTIVVWTIAIVHINWDRIVSLV